MVGDRNLWQAWIAREYYGKESGRMAEAEAVQSATCDVDKAYPVSPLPILTSLFCSFVILFGLWNNFHSMIYKVDFYPMMVRVHERDVSPHGAKLR